MQPPHIKHDYEDWVLSKSRFGIFSPIYSTIVCVAGLLEMNWVVTY